MHQAQCLFELRGMQQRVLATPRLVDEAPKPARQRLWCQLVILQEVLRQASIVQQALETRVHEAGVAHVAEAAHATSCLGICQNIVIISYVSYDLAANKDFTQCYDT